VIDPKYLPDMLDEHQDFIEDDGLRDVLAAAAEEIRSHRRAGKTHRSYTLAEIDAMRSDIDLIIVAPAYSGSGCFFNSKDHPRIIEDRLRTCMMGGVDPAELRLAGQKAQDAINQAVENCVEKYAQRNSAK